jgi:predicted HNH restriction endonuclease
MDGSALDARIEAKMLDHDKVEFTIFSRSGGRNSSRTRNPDYLPALELLFERAALGGATLEAAILDSRIARQHPENERHIVLPSFVYPVANQLLLNGHARVLQEVKSSSGRMFRKPNASGVGNQNKQLRLLFTVQNSLKLLDIIEGDKWPNSQGPQIPTPEDSSERHYLEGLLTMRTHLKRERNPMLRRQAFERTRRDDPKLRCRACGFSFIDAYGELGADFIEMHHKIPVSSYIAPRDVSPSDLVPLCSNCHRMIHRRSPMLDVEELADILKSR